MSSPSYSSAQPWVRARHALSVLLVAAIALATLSVLTTSKAGAANANFTTVSTCDGYKYYLLENGSLNCSQNAQDWVTVGSTGYSLNALGYDAVMGSLIAMRIGSNKLFTIAGDGTATLVGNISGIPSSGVVVTGGDVDPATDTYYVNTQDNRFFAINLSTLSATELTSSIPFSLGADLVVEAGRIWTINNDSGTSPQYLEGFSLSDFSTISIAVGVSDIGPAGAQWTDAVGGGDGIIWYNNNSGKIYQSNDLSTGGTTPTVIGRNLSFQVPIDGATYWSLLPINKTTQRGDSQVQVSWDPSPSVDPGAIITYEVKAYDPDGNYAGSCTYTTASDTGNTCTVTGLTNGTPYTFTIKATNHNNGSQTSASFGPATPATVPSVPLNVTATGGNGSATISWTVPASNGGEPITGYTATAYDADGNVVGTCTYTGNDPSGTMSCTIDGLNNGSTYTFKVLATNVIGNGPPGSPTDPVTPATIPSAPNNPAATTGPGSATVSWTVPDTNGGADITGYTATAYDADGNVAGTCTYTGNNPTGTMSCEITGLSNGTAYTFKVYATNRVGDGPPSSPVGPVSTPDLPGAPNNVSFAGGGSQGSASISWTIPDTDGGSDITGYTATAYDADGNVAGTCTYSGNNPTGTMSCTITGLTLGASYTFKVYATNGVGDGPPASPIGPYLIRSWTCAPGQQIAVVNGAIYSTTDLVTWTMLSSGNETVNALAFNSNDGFAYGLVQKGNAKAQLDRVGGDGSVTRIGKIAGLPKATYLAGSIDQATGYYYVSSQNQTLWRIDLTNRTASQAFVPRVPPRFGADLLVQDGAVWTMTTTRVYSYNLDGSGQPSIWWLPRNHRNLHLGGLSMDDTGRLIVMSNQNGNVFRVGGFGHAAVSVTDVGDFTTGVPMGLDVDLTACSI